MPRYRWSWSITAFFWCIRSQGTRRLGNTYTRRSKLDRHWRQPMPKSVLSAIPIARWRVWKRAALSVRWSCPETPSNWAIIRGTSSMWVVWGNPVMAIHGLVLSCGTPTRRQSNFNASATMWKQPAERSWMPTCPGFWPIDFSAADEELSCLADRGEGEESNRAG